LLHPKIPQKKEKNMSVKPIVTCFREILSPFHRSKQQTLDHFYLHPEQCPKRVRESAEAMHCLQLIGPLGWEAFPDRDLQRRYGQAAVSYAAVAAACLLKLEHKIGTFADLTTWLGKNPSICWLLGWEEGRQDLNAARGQRCTSLPSQRHFCRLLQKMPNACLQYLLDSSVRLLLDELLRRGVEIPETVSLDTKHIIAWVKENNPKAYVEERFDKTRQPKGDPDCRLGCKRRHNQHPTPAANPLPAATLTVGEFYWGYASGIAAMKVPGWGEMVLAELTQPFDQADLTYFFPLMAQVERRLGKKPRFAALDAAFDAFYVYDYFDQVGGFAAVPFTEKGKLVHRRFDADGLPLCAAGLPMPLRTAYRDRTTALIEYERGQYVCPLFASTPPQPCPIDDPHWRQGGCLTSLSTSIGARIRHQLDRQSPAYHAVYNQRTAAERIFSQAAALGIERPHLRNGKAIANLNTLTYILINLHLLQRIRNQD
jgi:hypothetical protein